MTRIVESPIDVGHLSGIEITKGPEVSLASSFWPESLSIFDAVHATSQFSSVFAYYDDGWMRMLDSKRSHLDAYFVF